MYPAKRLPTLLRNTLHESLTAQMRRPPYVEDDAAPSMADYTVACICPLGLECAAVEGMLDEIHDPLPTSRDQNAYTLGRIGPHNVVVAVMPEMGNNAAATTATQLLNDFPSFRFGLLVGIGGGVPGSKQSGDDVRLGDVVVSQPTGGFGGVIQYDMGKKLMDGNFQRTGYLNKPPEVLSAYVRRLEARHYRVQNKISSYLAEMLQRYPKMQDHYQHPGLECDQLFCWDYLHQGGPTCEECDKEQTVPRSPRRDTEPRVHYGTIGSANTVVKDAVTRNQLKRDTGVLCVEMEAAGLMDTFPCLVIRGICDYADSHKNKRWQPYAAATAAAYMKELLMMIPAQQVKQTPSAREQTKAAAEAVLDVIEGPIRKTENLVQYLYKKQQDSHEAEILSWVSKTPYEKHYKAAREGLLVDSGRWLFEKPEFEKWRQFDGSRMFWLSGKPGAGKTKLCAMLVHTLVKQDEDVIYFFCSRNANDPDRQDPKVVLRALIHQLALRSQDGLPKVLRDAFDRRHSTGMTRDGLDFDESYDLLVKLLNDHARTTIIIDALDECSEQSRSSLMQSLRKLVDHSTSLVRVFVSSRGDRDIAVRLQDVPKTSINQELTGADMKRFVEQEVRHSIKYKDLLYGEVSPELQEKITAELLAKADGMFLWVRLQIQLLCRMQTEHQVCSLLGRLPPTLSETYDRLFEKIQQSPSAYEANTALGWLMCAREPLRPTQWASAVSWTLDKKSGGTQPSRLSAETLLGMCQNLVVYDEMQNNIAFAHFSVREYLERKPRFDELHLETIAARTCLRFMIDTRLPRPSELEYGFYRYSARHWIGHVKATAEFAPSELDEFLGRWQEHTTAYSEWKGAVELFGRRHQEYKYADEIATLTNGLLLAAYYGIRHTTLWRRSRYNPNATDERGLSLLALASMNGQKRIVELLIRNGATINPASSAIDSRTAMCVYKPRQSYASWFQADDCHPLFLAIQNGHPEVAMTLLNAGATFKDISVLLVAAAYGPPNVLQHILEQTLQSEVSEQDLVMAAMNKSHPQTLKACLKTCEDYCITGNVIEAILDHRKDGKDIITQQLASRISARVLTRIWRRKRLGILTTLLEWVPDLPVSRDIVEQLALDAPPGTDCVVEILRSLLPDESITSMTLKAVFRVRYQAVDTLRVLLLSKSCRNRNGKAKALTHTEIAKSPESLQRLFNENVSVQLTEELLVAALFNRKGALELARLLLSRRQPAPITESAVEEAVANKAHGFQILELLFSTGRFVPITEEIVAAAARNKECGPKMIGLLLSKTQVPTIGDKYDGRIQKQLLEKQHAFNMSKSAPSSGQQGSPDSKDNGKPGAEQGRLGVSEDEVMAAIDGGLKAVETLLAQYPSLPVTERVLKRAAMGLTKSVPIFGLLLAKNAKLTMSESVLVEAARNTISGNELTKLIIERADALPISDAFIQAVLQNKYSGTEILQTIFGSPKTVVGVSVVCTAAIDGHETLFGDLLSRVDWRLMEDKYGVIFSAAIEGGNSRILQQCIAYGGVWPGTDKHGWNADLMAYHKHQKSVLSLIREKIGRRPAAPIPPNAWKKPESPSVRLVGTTVRTDADDESDICIRANHPLIPVGTSYFEVEILELDEPDYYAEEIQDSLAIGVTDERMVYTPSYYTNTGYVHDLFLMSERRGFRKGDTVGYGIDWERKQQFIVVHGVRDETDRCFEQLYERRMFPFVRVYAGAGICMLKANFQGPFLYKAPTTSSQ